LEADPQTLEGLDAAGAFGPGRKDFFLNLDPATEPPQRRFNILSRVAGELGNVYRTIFLLEWISDELMRQDRAQQFSFGEDGLLLLETPSQKPVFQRAMRNKTLIDSRSHRTSRGTWASSSEIGSERRGEPIAFLFVARTIDQ
jgi:hypothetical protein